jgi:hypothetical protein
MDDAPLAIKSRNDVYYEMYRGAVQKAREARNLAIATYLEAQRIKNLYMLDEAMEEDAASAPPLALEFTTTKGDVDVGV